MTDAADGKLTEAVLAAVQEDGDRIRLACSEALALAARFEVSPLAVTRICNERDIKISKCQLGCFK